MGIGAPLHEFIKDRNFAAKLLTCLAEFGNSRNWHEP